MLLTSMGEGWSSKCGQGPTGERGQISVAELIPCVNASLCPPRHIYMPPHHSNAPLSMLHLIRQPGRERSPWVILLPVFYCIFSALLGTQSVVFSKSLSVLLRMTFSVSGRGRNGG